MSKRLSDAQQVSQDISRSVEIVEMIIRPKLRDIPTPFTVRVWEWFAENWALMFVLCMVAIVGILVM